jgi:hypothetical protein
LQVTKLLLQTLVGGLQASIPAAAASPAAPEAATPATTTSAAPPAPAATAEAAPATSAAASPAPKLATLGCNGTLHSSLQGAAARTQQCNHSLTRFASVVQIADRSKCRPLSVMLTGSRGCASTKEMFGQAAMAGVSCMMILMAHTYRDNMLTALIAIHTIQTTWVRHLHHASCCAVLQQLHTRTA